MNTRKRVQQILEDLEKGEIQFVPGKEEPLDVATDAIVELIKGAVPTKRSDNLGMKE